MPCWRASRAAFRPALMMSGAAVTSIWVARPSQVRRCSHARWCAGSGPDRVTVPVPGGAAPPGEGGADRRAPAVAGAGQRGFGDAGERGQLPGDAGLGEAGPPPCYTCGARWVEPSLAGEAAFTERTRDGSLRHPSWRGLRHDTDPGHVHREPG
jgi:ATP dependent DNA ligase C terminal region